MKTTTTMKKMCTVTGKPAWLLIPALLSMLACSSPADESVTEGTSCDEQCPVGAQKVSMKSADGSCSADGSYSTTMGSVSGQCAGYGECQVACIYPECSDNKILIITDTEFRCEVADTGPCKDVDCSGHGECQVVFDAVQCICEQGFKPLGAYCVVEDSPIVFTVSPTSATVGEKEYFTVEGAYLPDTLEVVLENCPDAAFTKHNETQAEFVCTPDAPGVSKRQILVNAGGDVLYQDEAVFDCPGCQIDGACVQAGTLAPANPCLVCEPDSSYSFWSFNDGLACDDGNFCNGGDTCKGGSCSAHSGDPCQQDGAFCNGIEYCDVWGQECTSTGAPCADDQNPCNGEESCSEDDKMCVHSGDPCQDDEDFCNGKEFCDPTDGSCVHSGNPCLDDGNYCNGEESCDADAATCVHSGNPCSDDGVFCNGLEYCDASQAACVSTGDPCIDDLRFCNGQESCAEDLKACVSSGNPCVNDGDFCTGVEFCDEVVSDCVTTGNPCVADGNFCNGDELCDSEAQECVHTGNPCIDDGLYCTGIELCDPVSKQCVQTGDPCMDDGSFCNGEEQCDEQTLACKSSGNPCINDGQFCNGVEFCDPVAKACVSTGNPCKDDGVFCNGEESCAEEEDTCPHSGNPCPDDGDFCNGVEFCDSQTNACLTTGNPCPEDANWCNGTESCDPVKQECTHSGNPCSDDGLFCTGVESCDAAQAKCVASGNPCPDDGMFCNGAESCNEQQNACKHAGNPCQDDTVFCNGLEYCDESEDGCLHSGDPCPDDANPCNGGESCAEDEKQCLHSGNPCQKDSLFCNGSEYCDPTDGKCKSTGSPCPDDGLYCNGTESCSEEKKSCLHSGTPCHDDGVYCNGAELCDEASDQCLHSGDPCPNDWVFCNGDEVCNAQTDTCAHSGDPCDVGEYCVENVDECHLEVHIGEGTAGWQEAPKVAMWDDGTFVIVWEEDNDQTQAKDILGRLFDADGKPQGASFVVDSEPGDQVDPAVSVSESGQFVVVWHSYKPGMSSPCMDGYCTYRRMYSKAGQPLEDTQWSGIEYSKSKSTVPDVQIDDSGKYMWLIRNRSSGEYIRYMVQLANGDLSPDVPSLPNNTANPAPPAIGSWYEESGISPGTIALAENGIWFIAFVMPDTGLNISSFSKTGEPFKSKADIVGHAWPAIVSSGWGDLTRPDLTALSTGYLAAAWARPDAAHPEWDDEIWLRRVSHQWKTVSIFGFPFEYYEVKNSGSQIHANQYTSGRQGNVMVTVLPTGNLVAVWESLGQDGSGKGIVAREFNSTLQAVGNEFVVNQETMGDQYQPDIASSASGAHVVVWTTAYSGEKDVYLRFFPAP